MGMSIGTNLSSLGVQKTLESNSSRLSQATRRLSSGLRIQSAADDAAGLVISKGLEAKIQGFQQALRNVGDAISMSTVAESTLNEVGNILSRMRELAVQSSNGTLSTAGRSSLQSEFQSLKSEISRIASATEFVGQQLLDGTTSSGIVMQVGINSGVENVITFYGTDSRTVGMGSVGTGALSSLEGAYVSTASLALAALSSVDSSISSVTASRGTFGALTNRLQFTLNNIANSIENYTAANARIKDVDIASETASLTSSQVIQQAAVAILGQANQQPNIALSLLK